MIRRITYIVSVMLCATSIALAQEGNAGNINFTPTTYTPSNGEAVEAERGTLWVPANRSKPDSGLYKLAFIRFKSTSDNPGTPIVYLAGGPGGSGIESARGGRFPLFMAMRAYGDVIAFDQRGTGISEPRPIITLTRDYPLDEPVDFAAFMKPLITQTKSQLDALEEDGLDLASFNTEENADDLNDLRIALGEDKISLWGISYGTHLGLSTIRRHGQHIHKAMLAGLEGPDQSIKLPSDQEALLEDLSERVKNDPELGEHIPDLMKLLRSVLEDLEQNPVMVKAFDMNVRERVDVLIDQWSMQFAIASLLGTTSSSRTIPQLVYNASQGDFMRVGNAALMARRASDRQLVMALLMDCASGATEARLQHIALEADETLLGQTINFIFPEICAACGDIDLGDDFRGPLTSDVRTLFISGTLDGRTSVANAEALIPGFSDSEHLIIEGAGHSDELFLSSPEILKTIQEFMGDKPLSTNRIKLPPMKFAKPRFR